MFEEYLRFNEPYITDEAINKAKDDQFAEWCRDYMNGQMDYTGPLWLLEFVQGPLRGYKSWPIYFTRGYTFHNYEHGKNKKTMNYGVCVRGASSESEYFGLLQEIFMIEYYGSVGLQVMVFRCAWFNQALGYGVRRNASGIVDICPRRKYEKYDPFIVPENADQVCYIPYPRLRKNSEEWWAASKVIPRGFRDISTKVDEPPLQEEDDHNQNVVVSGVVQVSEHAVEAISEDDMEIDDHVPVVVQGTDDNEDEDEDEGEDEDE